MKGFLVDIKLSKKQLEFLSHFTKNYKKVHHNTSLLDVLFKLANKGLVKIHHENDKTAIFNFTTFGKNFIRGHMKHDK